MISPMGVADGPETWCSMTLKFCTGKEPFSGSGGW